MTAAMRAARAGDQVAHGFGLMGMVAGAIAGAVIGAAIIGAGVATGGVAIVAIVGGCIAGGGLAGGSLVNGLMTMLDLPDPTTGKLGGGSPNVTVNGRAALRAGLDTASDCHGLWWFNHFPKSSIPIAQGAQKVTVNGYPMARVSMKLVCGAKIKSGSNNVKVGGPTAQVLEIHDAEEEFKGALEILGVVSLGAAFWAAGAAGGLLGIGKLALLTGAMMEGTNLLESWGNSLTPGLGDVLVGTAGLGLMFASARNPGKALDALGRPNREIPVVLAKRPMGGLRRPAHVSLDDAQIARLTEEFIEVGGDPSILRFNKGHQTSYVDDTDIINVRGDVLPIEGDIHPRSSMSSRAALAHELGHRANRGTPVPPGSWNDEFRASYWAAKNAPNLTMEERADLLSDAMLRAREAGVPIKMNKFIREILYGY